MTAQLNNKGKPDWKAKTKGCADCVFYIGKSIQDDFIGNNRDICAYYIHKTYGLWWRRSIIMKKGQITISDMEPPLEFETVKDNNEQLKTLNAILEGRTIERNTSN